MSDVKHVLVLLKELHPTDVDHAVLLINELYARKQVTRIAAKDTKYVLRGSYFGREPDTENPEPKVIPPDWLDIIIKKTDTINRMRDHEDRMLSAYNLTRAEIQSVIASAYKNPRHAKKEPDTSLVHTITIEVTKFLTKQYMKNLERDSHVPFASTKLGFQNIEKEVEKILIGIYENGN